MSQYSFSIFTPVYNRGGGVLERVYNSLQRQTYSDFEWIIVNDGSTDNTDLVIKDIINRANFPIKYIFLGAQQWKACCAKSSSGCSTWRILCAS